MLINSRFEVNPSRSEILDRDTKKLVRLEPRLMKLLCLLIENKGQIVVRELIITEIWNDYPGAGEGLNQSISGLRKILHDEKKQLIETLPKMGYCFHGSIAQSSSVNRWSPLKATYFIAGLILLLIAIFGFMHFYSGNRKSDRLSREEGMRIYKIDSAHQAEQLKENRKKNGK